MSDLTRHPDMRNVRRDLIAEILGIQGINNPVIRDRLLSDLPQHGLQRDYNQPAVDVSVMIEGLASFGMLDEQGGVRPLVRFVENALDLVPSTSDRAKKLGLLKRRVSALYDASPESPNLPGVTAKKELLIFGQEGDRRVDVRFVNGLQRAMEAVARIRVPRYLSKTFSNYTFGTGWLIREGLLLTNHHVVNARKYLEPAASPEDLEAQVAGAEFWFDYVREDPDAKPRCKGAKLLKCDARLDYALLELSDGAATHGRKTLTVHDQKPELARGARMNIVQHPKGGAMQFAIRNNFYVQQGDTAEFIRYQTDTEEGASGSPVCDDDWRVVALHHGWAAVPPQDVPQEITSKGSEQPLTFQLNEATTLAAILQDLGDTLRERVLKSGS